MSDITDAVTPTVSGKPGNVDSSHTNQMKTYSGPEFADDSFACFFSGQECNVLLHLECLQMRVKAWGWRAT